MCAHTPTYTVRIQTAACVHVCGSAVHKNASLPHSQASQTKLTCPIYQIEWGTLKRRVAEYLE